jgi:hypothetical protein
MVLIEGIDCNTVSEQAIPGCNTSGKRDSQNYTNGAFYPAQQSGNSGSLIIALGDMAAGQYVNFLLDVVSSSYANQYFWSLQILCYSLLPIGFSGSRREHH